MATSFGSRSSTVFSPGSLTTEPLTTSPESAARDESNLSDDEPESQHAWGSIRVIRTHVVVSSTELVNQDQQIATFTCGRRSPTTNSHLTIDGAANKVSRSHFNIEFDKENCIYYLQDLDSKTGTFWNETKLCPEVPTKINSVAEITFSYPNLAHFCSSLQRKVRRGKEETITGDFVSVLFEGKSKIARELDNFFPPEIVPSSHINQLYWFHSLLGQGGAGKVYKCTERRTLKTVAVKHTIAGFADKEKVPESIAQEIEILGQLDHQNIIKFYSTVIGPSTECFAVLEFAPGGDLRKRLSTYGAYPYNRAKIIVKELLEAVQYLHHKKIIHRDIKVENILMSKPIPEGIDSIEGIIEANADIDSKLADFGTAKEGIVFDSYCGTVYTMAPEVHAALPSGERMFTYSFPADMWSVGIATCAILTQRVFGLKKESGRVSGVTRDDPLLSNLSEDAKDFLVELLQVDPTKRMNATEALQHRFIQSE